MEETLVCHPNLVARAVEERCIRSITRECMGMNTGSKMYVQQHLQLSEQRK